MRRDTEPELRRSDWLIIEAQTGQRHFVGHNIDDCEGRVSSAILQFDPVTRGGVTASGRIYELVWKPGYDADAAYGWQGEANQSRPVVQERDA